MRLAVDTNRCTDFFRGDDGAVERLETAEAVYLPFVVVGELRAGFAVGRHGRENEGLLGELLLRPGVDVLWPGDQTTHHYAGVFRQLREQGTPIPTNDIWIAALALEHSLVLYARDRHFDHLPQITRV